MDERQAHSLNRVEFVEVARRTITELEAAIGRQIERVETAMRAADPDEMVRRLRPAIADLKRMRAGVHRHVYKPAGIIPAETHPAQEAARLFAELSFCADHISKVIDRLSQLEEAGEIVSWAKHLKH